MNRGIIYSILLHGVFLLMLFFGLPSFFDKKILEDTVVTVEVLPISAVSNVKPAKMQPTPQKPAPSKPEPVKKEPPKPAPPKPQPKAPPKPAPKVEPVKMEDAVPIKPAEKPKPPKKEEPKKPEPTPEPKKPEPKKPEPQKEKPKEKDIFDSDSLEKDLQKKAEEKQQKEAFDSLEDSLTKKSTKAYDASMPLSISETDAIRQQFYSCWNPPLGARDLENMAAVVRVVIEKDGTVSDAKLVPNSRYAGDNFYQAFAESALRAVYKCSPLKVMPAPDKFLSWHEMELTFTPKDMF